MTSNEVCRRLEEDKDYIACKRFDYSLKKLMARYPEDKYPDRVPTKVIAQAMNMTEDELDAFEKQIICKMQALLGVDLS